MKKIFLILLSVILFTACTVASPLTTTKNWLEAMKNDNYDEALGYMELENKDKFMNEYKEKFGKVVSYEIQNAIPLSSEELKNLSAIEGNTVYYKVAFEKSEVKNTKIQLIKRGGQWKIIYLDK